MARMIIGWSVPVTLVPISSSSNSFSAVRSPVYSISMSPSGLLASRTVSPMRFIRRRARSSMRTGRPMSSTNTSPALGHRAGLHHQLRGLGDRHEVADDVRMGHGDRTAAADLLLEQRHHRAGGCQHVAEAHHAEARVRGALLQRLQHQLRQALGGAHDVRRVHRLVGRDQHEGLDPGLERRFRRVPGADDVVVDALDHVVLDDRHVLVGGRVVDRLHAEGRRAPRARDGGGARCRAAARSPRRAARGPRPPRARARCCRARAPTSRTAPGGWARAV